MILLFPLNGMEFNGSLLRFGDAREDAERLLGPAEFVRGNRCYYLGGELALDFDESGKLEFIECLGGIQGTLQPELYGESVFAADADELLKRLTSRGAPEDQDGGYTVTIPALSIGFYREITPADVEAMVREMSRMDVTTLGHVNLEEEYRRARHWDTVGIGGRDYYGTLR